MDFSSITHSDLWFSDGNVIMFAESKAFKCHRGQLSRHSEVFAGLFSIPQPTDQPLYEGYPWVQLYDSAVDVLHFLRALYDGLYFETHTSADFPMISSVLRLSSKYLVEHLRTRCLSRLQQDWPSTLVGWDKREAAATDDTGRYLPRETCAHPILVLNLAAEQGLDSLIPSAFYDLSRYGPSKIMAGVTDAQASEEVADDKANSSLCTVPSARLPLSVLIAVFRGREQSQRFIANFITTSLVGRLPATDCLLVTSAAATSSRACRESFYFIMLNMLRSVGGIACGRDGDPLYTLTQAMDMLVRTDFSDGTRMCGLGLCANCKKDFKKDVIKAREEVWKKLPVWFGIASEDEEKVATSS